MWGWLCWDRARSQPAWSGSRAAQPRSALLRAGQKSLGAAGGREEHGHGARQRENQRGQDDNSLCCKKIAALKMKPRGRDLAQHECGANRGSTSSSGSHPQAAPQGHDPQGAVPVTPGRAPPPRVGPQGQAGGHQLSQPQGSHGTFYCRRSIKKPLTELGASPREGNPRAQPLQLLPSAAGASPSPRAIVLSCGGGEGAALAAWGPFPALVWLRWQLRRGPQQRGAG